MSLMREGLGPEFQQKTKTPLEGVKIVRDGDVVYLGACTSGAYELGRALGMREGELQGVTLACSLMLQPMSIMRSGAFKINTFFMGPQERAGLLRGATDYTSLHLSEMERWCYETAKPDVAFLEVSLPDEKGYMSFGATGVALHHYIKESAERIVLQINQHVPYVYGEKNLIHISEADAVVWKDEPLVENPELEIDDRISAISNFLVEQIPDGACIQLGLGGVSNAVGYGLQGKNDLGAHSELMTDSIMKLMKSGVINNRRKNYMVGKTVASFTFGSRELYEFIHKNEDMYYMPFPMVNDPRNIAKNDNMISINTALSIDLLGQVCADNISGRQYSATGGQVDFIRGAQMSRGGKSFIAMESTVKGKEAGVHSRIVSRLPLGSVVTTPRSDVEHVVTEYGCVNLKPLTMRDRVRAMISLAHPDFRERLKEEAIAGDLL